MKAQFWSDTNLSLFVRVLEDLGFDATVDWRHSTVEVPETPTARAIALDLGADLIY